MKEYLKGIEKVLGIVLEAGEIERYQFKDDILGELLAFSESYRTASIDFPRPEIGSYTPFPDLYHLGFRSYSADKLERHWPTDEELAACALCCDRVIIHDHLGHYAGSAITGYTVGYRYSGLRSWLKALARWRPLILEDVLCILPQKLAYTPQIKDIFNDEEFIDFGHELLSIIYPDEDPWNAPFDDLVFNEIAIDYYLAMASIPRADGRYFAPYFNDREGTKRHMVLVSALMQFLKKHRYTEGSSIENGAQLWEIGNFAMIRAGVPDGVLKSSPEEIRKLRSEEGSFVKLREVVRNTFREFSVRAPSLKYSPNELNSFLGEQQALIDSLFGGTTIKRQEAGVTGTALSFYFAGTVIEAPGQVLSASLRATLDALNNLPVAANLPGTFCHYFITCGKETD